MALVVQPLHQYHPNQNHITNHLYFILLFDFIEYPDLIEMD